MPEEIKQQSDPAETKQTTAAAEPAQVDNRDELTKAFSNAWNKGKESGRKEILKTIEEIFGTTDIESLKPVVKKTEVVKDIEKQYQEKLLNLESELQTIKAKEKNQIIENSIKSAFEALNLRPKKSSTALNEFLAEHDISFEDGVSIAYKKGSRIPITTASGIADLKEAVKQFSENKENSWLFAPSGQVKGSIDIDTRGINQELPAGFLKNPANLEALKRTNQLEPALAGQPVNMAKVKEYLESANVKNLRIVKTG